MIWIVFALSFEAKGIKHFISGGKPIRVVTLGACGSKAEIAFERALIECNQTPEHVILAGLAGGLDPNLRIGDIIWSGKALKGLQENLASNETGIRRGRIHTAPQLVGTAGAKQSLRSKLGADCVDMESGLVEATCRHRSISLTVIRAISDRSCDNLPVPVNILISPKTLRPSVFSLALHLALKPLQINGFFSMVSYAIQARSRLHSTIHLTLS